MRVNLTIVRLWAYSHDAKANDCHGLPSALVCGVGSSPFLAERGHAWSMGIGFEMVICTACAVYPLPVMHDAPSEKKALPLWPEPVADKKRVVFGIYGHHMVRSGSVNGAGVVLGLRISFQNDSVGPSRRGIYNLVDWLWRGTPLSGLLPR